MTISIPMPSAVSGAVALGAFLPVIARSTVDNRYFETAGSSAMLDRQLRTAIAYSAVRDRIEVWKALPSDWDGREGIPPPE